MSGEFLIPSLCLVSASLSSWQQGTSVLDVFWVLFHFLDVLGCFTVFQGGLECFRVFKGGFECFRVF
jgi:hypothetical protein